MEVFFLSTTFFLVSLVLVPSPNSNFLGAIYTSLRLVRFIVVKQKLIMFMLDMVSIIEISLNAVGQPLACFDLSFKNY